MKRRELGSYDARSNVKNFYLKFLYRRFVRRVVDSIHEYLRHQDVDALTAAAAELQVAFTESNVARFASTGQTFKTTGWLSASSTFSINVRALREQNPLFTVRVRRHARRELLRGFRQYGFRPGFEVSATSEITKVPFLFFVLDGAGNPSRLQTSNREARLRRSILDAGNGFFEKFETWPAADSGAGFVDSIRTVGGTQRGNFAKSQWFSSLVHEFPTDLLVLVDSEPGSFAAAAAADALRTFPVNARWRDRFELAAYGSDGTFSSDLVPVRVERPYGPLEPSHRSTLLLPVLEKHDGVARSTTGTSFVRQPNTQWLTFDDVHVQGGGTVVQGSSLICFEAAADPTHDFVSGQWASIFGSRRKADGALVELSEAEGPGIVEGILLSGRNDENWYHWFLEYMPRALMVPEGISADIPLLVSSRTPESGLAVLRGLTRRPIIVLDAAVRTRVGKLHVVAPPTQILDTTLVPWKEGVSMNPAPLRAMRALLREATDAGTVSRRVFLVRNSRHRGVRNADQIIRIAEERGLELVDPAELTWEQQRDLFSSAELVVGAGGAVMANYLIMPEGSHVIALTSELLGDFILPALICEVAGVRFEYVLGRTKTVHGGSRKKSERMHDDFHINPRHFRAELDRALKDLESVSEIRSGSADNQYGIVVGGQQ